MGVIGIALYLLTPPITAGLVFAEHSLLWRVKRDPGLDGAARRLLFAAVYLAPLLFFLAAALTLAGLTMDGMSAWLGEVQPIDRRDEFTFNLFIVMAVAWPLLLKYGLLGGMVARLVWLEGGRG